MNGIWSSRVVGSFAAVGLVMGSVAILRLHPAIQSGAVAPVLLLVVLIVARAWGIIPALVASVTGSLGYSYFFLASVGFGIENLNDWAAFLSFTVVAILAGELAARADRRQREAEAGRLEIERLYQELQVAFDRASEAEAARRSGQLKAALLDALTHNLRTPLTAIKASVTALLGPSGWNKGPSGSLSQEGRRELLEVIDEESDRLNRFIEGLSAADHREPAQPLTFSPASLNDIVHEGLTRAGTVTRDHKLDVLLDPRSPPVSVEPAAVAEVLYILLDNASKYSPAGTTIRVEASRRDEHFAQVTVTDQGPGVPAELRNRVFEKFFRIPGRDPIDSRRPRGIGLGLPIARRLIEAQAGRLWIEAGAGGRGTAVIMTIPFVAGSGAQAAQAQQTVQTPMAS